MSQPVAPGEGAGFPVSPQEGADPFSVRYAQLLGGLIQTEQGREVLVALQAGGTAVAGALKWMYDAGTYDGRNGADAVVATTAETAQTGQEAPNASAERTAASTAEEPAAQPAEKSASERYGELAASFMNFPVCLSHASTGSDTHNFATEQGDMFFARLRESKEAFAQAPPTLMEQAAVVQLGRMRLDGEAVVFTEAPSTYSSYMTPDLQRANPGQQWVVAQYRANGETDGIRGELNFFAVIPRELAKRFSDEVCAGGKGHPQAARAVLDAFFNLTNTSEGDVVTPVDKAESTFDDLTSSYDKRQTYHMVCLSSVEGLAWHGHPEAPVTAEGYSRTELTVVKVPKADK